MHATGITFLDMNTDEGRAAAAAYKEEKAAMVKSGQQIYAKIKKTSKYFGQGQPGALFPVFIDAHWHKADYVVKGGPGGQYRLADVNLFVVADGHELKIG